MDYTFADRTVIPEFDQPLYTEKVAYLPDSYQADDDQRQVADAPQQRSEVGPPENAFVSCCLNSVHKLVPALLDVWMRVLKRVPGSLLLHSDAPEAAANLRFEAGQHSGDASRLHLAASWRPQDHLARLRLADLLLDTLPDHAQTTGSDALWAVLPLLTCIGPTLAGRRLRCSNQRLTRGILTGPLRPWLGVTAQACHHLPSTCQCSVEPPYQWGNCGC